jgi:hypothetical protein
VRCAEQRNAVGDAVQTRAVLHCAHTVHRSLSTLDAPSAPRCPPLLSLQWDWVCSSLALRHGRGELHQIERTRIGIHSRHSALQHSMDLLGYARWLKRCDFGELRELSVCRRGAAAEGCSLGCSAQRGQRGRGQQRATEEEEGQQAVRVGAVQVAGGARSAGICCAARMRLRSAGAVASCRRRVAWGRMTQPTGLRGKWKEQSRRADGSAPLSLLGSHSQSLSLPAP